MAGTTLTFRLTRVAAALVSSCAGFCYPESDSEGRLSRRVLRQDNLAGRWRFLCPLGIASMSESDQNASKHTKRSGGKSLPEIPVAELSQSLPAAPAPPAKPQPPKLLTAPFDANTAKAAQVAWADYLNCKVDFCDQFGHELRLIPSGEYEMGSDETVEQLEAARFILPNSDWRRWIKAESPRHRVRITRPFYLGVSSVTHGQFASFVRETGYRTEAETDGKGGRGYDASTNSISQTPEFTWKNTGFEQTNEHPVVNVTWKDVQAYVNWLNKNSAKSGHDGRYRLPREAEWEYACRAGTMTRFFAGDTMASLQGFANVQDESFSKAFPRVDFGEWQKFPFDDGFSFTSPAGRYKSNPFGLCDMLGNVWAWCEDWYDANYYASSPIDDPPGPPSGASRVLRGGSWYGVPAGLRSSFRYCYAPGARGNHVGCRVLLELP